MRKLTDWHKHEANVKGWRMVMAQELAKEALDVARCHVLPKTIQSPSNDAQTIITLAALEQARQGGWHAALSFLEDVLTNVPPPAAAPLKSKTLKPDT